MKKNGYVIIEGNIGAGKSTFAEAIASALQDHGQTATKLMEPDEESNPFLPLYYSDPKRWAFTMQAFLLGKRFEMTQYAQHGALSGRGWFVMDRSYFGDLYFAVVQKHDRFFTSDEFNAYVNLHHAMQANIHYPTAAIFLNCSPEICKKRIDKRMSEKAGRVCESSISMDYLESLQREIDKMNDFLSRQTKVISLDWNGDKDESGLKKAADQVVEILMNDERSNSIYSPWGACAASLFD